MSTAVFTLWPLEPKRASSPQVLPELFDAWEGWSERQLDDEGRPTTLGFLNPDCAVHDLREALHN